MWLAILWKKAGVTNHLLIAHCEQFNDYERHLKEDARDLSTGVLSGFVVCAPVVPHKAVAEVSRIGNLTAGRRNMHDLAGGAMASLQVESCPNTIRLLFGQFHAEQPPWQLLCLVAKMLLPNFFPRDSDVLGWSLPFDGDVSGQAGSSKAQNMMLPSSAL